jgi:starch synthase (maltosyl-transferring)
LGGSVSDLAPESEKKIEAQIDVSVELLEGAELLDQASQRARSRVAKRLRKWAQALRSQPADPAVPALDDDLADLMARYPDRQFATTYDKALTVIVDPLKARHSTWYELFPRSCLAPLQPGQHGSFKSCAERLPDLAAMGFDVLYLPPIHPIGQTHRKGKNNTLTARPDDVGSPWAIGADEGGHKSVHPELGSLKDFRSLVAKAKTYDIDIALDIAFQCSPDHPYVTAHPEWFRQRPDGSIQYAENPPKKYQDIYPFDFATAHWKSLWNELKSIFEFWIEQGVRLFRVDNPHTKSYTFDP